MSARVDNLNRWQGTVPQREAGFSLLEVLAALAILALASSSVLVVIDRCLASASDSTMRMEAFELVRENLEKILVMETVEETVDFGTSEKYPSISWQTVIEGFPEPVTGQMWVRAVCSADYRDSKEETQKIELVHWLSQLTDQQAGQMISQQELEKLEVEQTMKTDEEAAAYAKIDTDTLRKWVADGLVKTPENGFLRYNLDIFILSKGSPTPEEKAEQVDSVKALAMKLKMEQKRLEEEAALGKPVDNSGTGGTSGLPNGERGGTNADRLQDMGNRTR